MREGRSLKEKGERCRDYRMKCIERKGKEAESVGTAVTRPLRHCTDEDGRGAGMTWAAGNCVSISSSANRYQ